MRAIHPDPIRPPPPSQHAPKLSGCGPHRSFRHLHHQRGRVGTFHVRLLEGRELRRAHWSALSLGPARLLGLSSASGEVSSFGSFRLAFWGEEDHAEAYGDGMEGKRPASLDAADSMTPSCSSSSGRALPVKSGENAASSDTSRALSFLPSMPSSAPNNTQQTDSIKSPLTPFDQGCLASMSPARSPFFPAFAIQPTQKPNHTAAQQQSKSGKNSQPFPSQPFPLPSETKPPKSMTPPPQPPSAPSGPTPPHHYAKEQFRSPVIHNDSNPIWGDATAARSPNSSTFRIPLHKDDLYPSLHSDGMRIALEIRLEEEMAPTESLLVGGALSHAVEAATAATALVPVLGKSVGEHAHKGATAGMERLGLGKDRLIGRGYVDLMPLLLGVWEEEWETENGFGGDGGGKDVVKWKEMETEAEVEERGRIPSTAYRTKRRVERMGMLDVWVPLYRPSKDAAPLDSRGKVHLLISYEPNGMAPKPNDVVALESFARRPPSDASSLNVGSVITPILPPLSPLLVVDTRSSYLLVEYSTSRTITSVDRSGNVKSSKWERTHRVRLHRNSAFVIERRTLLDAVGDVARLPGDIVLSTPVGREVAEASAPIVAAAGELLGPALLWGKLMMAAGGTGVRAGLAGLRAATEAVVSTSQDMARSGKYERSEEAGVYRYGG